MNNIIYIIIIWIAINFIFPIFLKSVERQYQKEIDVMVKGFLWFLKQIIIRTLQLILIIFFLPNLLIGFFVQDIHFKRKRIKYFFDSFIMLKDGMFEKQFPHTLVKGFKYWIYYNKRRT